VLLSKAAATTAKKNINIISPLFFLVVYFRVTQFYKWGCVRVHDVGEIILYKPSRVLKIIYFFYLSLFTIKRNNKSEVTFTEWEYQTFFIEI
jgi:hypothetical protein